MITSPARPFGGTALYTVAAFSGGILAGNMVGAVAAFIFVVCSLCVLAITIRKNVTGTGAVLLTCFTAGMFTASAARGSQSPLPFSDELVNQRIGVSGRVTGTPRIINSSTTFLLAADSLGYYGVPYHVRGTVSCSIIGAEVSIAEGDRIAFTGALRARPRRVFPIDWFVVPSSPYDDRYRLVSVASENGMPSIEIGRGPFERLRRSLSDFMNNYPFRGHGALLSAMIFGDTRRLDPVLRDAFARSGIAHLLAVSGLHAAIIALALSFLMKLTGLGRTTQAIITVSFLFAYAGICGFRPPMLRTAVMMSLVLGGNIMGRRLTSEHTLALAVLLILAFDPMALYGPSFQLSCAAVWSIVTFQRPLTERSKNLLPRKGKARPVVSFLLSTFIMSLLATIGTAPVVAAHFGVLPVFAVVVNLIAVPLSFIIVYGALVTIAFALLGPFGAPVAYVLSAATGIFLAFLELIARISAALPYASVDTGMVSPFLALALMGWLFLLSRADGRPAVIRSLVYLPLGIILILVWQPVFASGFAEGNRERVVFFDAGQGDSALIMSTAGRFLVDTGTESASLNTVVPSLKALGVDRLDGIFLSHFDADHAGGLAVILGAFPVERIYCRASAADSLAQALNCQVNGLAAGDSISFGCDGIQILFPPPDSVLAYHGIHSENNRSLVFGYSTGALRYLFTGDVEPPAQRLLACWGAELRADVFKIPHHGARPIDNGFVTTVNPEIAVISCGLGNMLGHPAPETVQALEHAGATVYRTDRDGPVECFGKAGTLSTRLFSQ
jgi:competence protein ComEC